MPPGRYVKQKNQNKTSCFEVAALRSTFTFDFAKNMKIENGRKCIEGVINHHSFKSPFFDINGKVPIF